MSELARAPSAGERVPDSVDQAWEFGVGRAPSGPLAVGDSVLVAATTDKRIAVLHRGSGNLVWRTRLKGPGASGPLFTGDWVFAASGDAEGKVHAYELRSGKRRWMQTVGPAAGPIGLADSTIFVATLRGFLIALDAANGDVLWSSDFRRPLRAGVTVVGPHLVVASDDSLFLVSRETGQDIAAAETRGAIIRPPAVTGNLLVTTSPDGLVSAFAIPTLARRWERVLGDPIFGSPSIARDTVFVTTLGGWLWRIPLRSPAAAAAQDLGTPLRAPPAPVRDGVIVGTVGGAVLWIRSAHEGPVHWADVYGPIEEPPLVSRGEIFVIDGRGTIHVWGDRADRQEEP